MIKSSCCSEAPEMPSATVGIALFQYAELDCVVGEDIRAYLFVYGTYDSSTGWTDSKDEEGRPWCNFGLQQTITSIVDGLWEDWEGHVVNLHWELDSGTRLDAERLNVALPTHIHVPVRPDPPRWLDPETWTITFDDPPF